MVMQKVKILMSIFPNLLKIAPLCSKKYFKMFNQKLHYCPTPFYDPRSTIQGDE